MATTYCDRDDIESIVGPAFVVACCDDNEDGALSATETLRITEAIERAAVHMNHALDKQYVLSQLTSNDWCKWCNAYLAVMQLAQRKGNPPQPSVIDAVQDFNRQLEDIRWGKDEVPEQAPSFEHIPTVSNFNPELFKSYNPIRVVTEESTGASPVGNRKRNQAGQSGNL